MSALSNYSLPLEKGVGLLGCASTFMHFASLFISEPRIN